MGDIHNRQVQAIFTKLKKTLNMNLYKQMYEYNYITTGYFMNVDVLGCFISHDEIPGMVCNYVRITKEIEQMIPHCELVCWEDAGPTFFIHPSAFQFDFVKLGIQREIYLQQQTKKRVVYDRVSCKRLREEETENIIKWEIN